MCLYSVCRLSTSERDTHTSPLSNTNMESSQATSPNIRSSTISTSTGIRVSATTPARDREPAEDDPSVPLSELVIYVISAAALVLLIVVVIVTSGFVRFMWRRRQKRKRMAQRMASRRSEISLQSTTTVLSASPYQSIQYDTARGSGQDNTSSTSMLHTSSCSTTSIQRPLPACPVLCPDPHAHKHPASTSRLGKKP
eukprot:scpid28621/ scgid6177/ 